MQNNGLGANLRDRSTGSRDEKITRASLKSSVERVLSKQQVVILDSLNNIKVRRNTPRTHNETCVMDEKHHAMSCFGSSSSCL